VVILLNGAFGVGKTTVARELRDRLPGSLVFDPEKIGFILRRIPGWVPLAGRQRGDFQHLPLWRRLSIQGIRAARLLRPVVIVPMAFSELAYLREVRQGVARFDRQVLHFCLVAPLPVVHQRLLGRGEDRERSSWQFRRAAECCAVHANPAFAEQIATEAATAGQVAEQLGRSLLHRAPRGSLPGRPRRSSPMGPLDGKDRGVRMCLRQ
jgi:hypothetical protein